MEIKRPVVFEFNYYDNENDFAPDVDLTFRTTENYKLGDLHRFCKAFAAALGYSHNNIEEYFGEDIDDR